MAEIEAAFADGLRLLVAHDFSGAERAFEQALGFNPDRAQGWYLLGRARQELGKPEEAAQAHRRAVELQPGFVEAHNNLGVALKKLGRIGEALFCYREALRLRPDYVEARNNLGNALAQLDLGDEAIECFRLAIRYQPDYAEAHNNLGIALEAQGRWVDAEASLREAVRLRPDFATAFTNLGTVLAELGEYDQAMACYTRALAREPRLTEALCGRGCLVGRRGQLEEALAIFREAILLVPDSAELWGNHGYFLAEQGRIAEGIASYREAIRLGPDSRINQSNHLFFLNYDPTIGPAALLAEHRRGAAALFAGEVLRSHDGHDRSPGRPLRVGYVSPDFRRHAVASFVEPILANHDRRRVLAISYADVGSPDAVTARLRSMSHEWREIRHMADDRVEELIWRDRIDILVDLAGHTARNRLRIFARKPAPVQVTYLGYPGTTGLETFDALLTDAVVDPALAPPQSTEEPLRLPNGAYCYAPPSNAPEVAPLPMLRTGVPTFGSLHKLPKLNSGVLELWAAVLRTCPGARLMLFRDTLRGRARDEILAFFETRGIVAGRVEIRSDWKSDEHWSIFSSIDVALDVFPWCGHTTACESLWMGVPVVTLAGDRRSSRMTASVLTMIGLCELIADDPDQYIETAGRLVSDPARLSRLRGDLRERMRTSRLCDGPAFTRDLESAYESLWIGSCDRAR